jgi:hypothetical protein
MNAPLRVLGSSPPSFVDPRTGSPAFGSFSGPLPRVELPSVGIAARFKKRKRWVYAAFSSDEIWIALAVVRTGYAATAFSFAFDRKAHRMLAEATVLGPPTFAHVADGPHEEGAVARFSRGKSSVVVARAGSRLDVRASLGEIRVEAVLDERDAPAVSAIASLGDGLFDATEKRALLPTSGHADIAGRSFDLSGAFGGWDYTQGLLPRRTRWRWAFGLGRTTEGEPLGFNLVSGFVGEPECAAFAGGRVHPLFEPRIELEPGQPMRPWRVQGEGIDLRFTPSAVHRQRTRLVVVRSSFVQPVGTFEGTMRVGGTNVRLDGLPGVVEDQDVLW